MKFLFADILFISLFYFFSFAHLAANLRKKLPRHSSSDVENRYDLCYSWDTPYQSLPISFWIKHSLSRFPISHSPIPDSIISPGLSLTPETMVLDIGKHTFNYPWPHISLKYLHCTTPQGDTVHDLSPNLFMGHLLGRDLLPLWLQYVYILLLNHEGV